MNEIMSMALESGVWAALFCFLFTYMLKDSRSREKKYTATIEALTAQLGGASSALKICEEIKDKQERNLQFGMAIKGDTEHIKEGVEAIRASFERL